MRSFALSALPLLALPAVIRVGGLVQLRSGRLWPDKSD